MPLWSASAGRPKWIRVNMTCYEVQVIEHELCFVYFTLHAFFSIKFMNFLYMDFTHVGISHLDWIDWNSSGLQNRSVHHPSNCIHFRHNLMGSPRGGIYCNRLYSPITRAGYVLTLQKGSVDIIKLDLLRFKGKCQNYTVNISQENEKVLENRAMGWFDVLVTISLGCFPIDTHYKCGEPYFFGLAYQFKTLLICSHQDEKVAWLNLTCLHNNWPFVKSIIFPLTPIISVVNLKDTTILACYNTFSLL